MVDFPDLIKLPPRRLWRDREWWVIGSEDKSFESGRHETKVQAVAWHHHINLVNGFDCDLLEDDE